MKTSFWTAAALAIILLVAAVPGSDSDLMQQKSAHAERIFRYLALGDLAKVEVEASVLGKLAREVGFHEQSETFQAYEEDFLKTVDALKKEAGKGNMAGSYYEFSRMAGMCFSCHEHVRDIKD
ncbi:cytochrome c [bacterium]|nr:cytochrome c [bacterium]